MLMKPCAMFLLLACVLLPAASISKSRAELPEHAQVVVGPPSESLDNARVSTLRNAIGNGTAKQLMHDESATFEAAASQLLQVMVNSMPSEAEEQWVGSLLDHQPVLWQQHPETLSPWFIPVFDLAAQARALRLHWQMQARLAAVLPEFESTQAWTQAFIEAPQTLQPRMLRGLSPGSYDRLMQRPVPPGLGTLAWRALLQAQHRAAIWEQALIMAPDDALRHSLHGVWQLDADQARDWLDRARLQRTVLRSVVVAAFGQDPDTALRHARLFALLDSAQDSQSAAAALAADKALTDAALIDAFRAASGGRLQRSLALSLRLRDSAATRRFVADWVDSVPDDDPLRESLR